MLYKLFLLWLREEKEEKKIRIWIQVNFSLFFSALGNINVQKSLEKTELLLVI